MLSPKGSKLNEDIPTCVGMPRGKYVVPEDKIQTVNDTLEDVYQRLTEKMYPSYTDDRTLSPHDERQGTNPMQTLSRLRLKRLDEPAEDVAHQLCVTAQKMDEMLDAMITSRYMDQPQRSDRGRLDHDTQRSGRVRHHPDSPYGTKLQTARSECRSRPPLNKKQLRITNRPRSADSRSMINAQDKAHYTGTTLVTKQVLVELRKKNLELIKENEHLKDDNRTLRMLSDKEARIKRSQSFEQRNPMQSRTDTKPNKKITELQRKLQAHDDVRDALIENQETLQIKLHTLESELSRKTEILTQLRLQMTEDNQKYQDIRERNLKLIAENEVMQTKISDAESLATKHAEHEVILRKHLKEEYQEKTKNLEKEVEFMRKRLSKRKEAEQNKYKQEVTQLTEHYQDVISNLRKERETLRTEKEEALASLQKLADHDKAYAAKQVSKYLKQVRELEKTVHAMEQENSQLSKENEQMKNSLNKMKEKRGKDSDTILHIEEILRKHGGDLEQKNQILELENKELIDKNKELEERNHLREKEMDNVRQQLKSTREVLENRILDIRQTNEQIVAKNEELEKSMKEKEQEWLKTMTNVIGQEEISKRDAKSHFQAVIEKFEKEKHVLDEEIVTLRNKLEEIQQEKDRFVTQEEEGKKHDDKLNALQTEINSQEKEKETALRRLQEIERELKKISLDANTSKVEMKKEYESKLERLLANEKQLISDREQLQAKVDELEYAISLQAQEEEEKNDNGLQEKNYKAEDNGVDIHHLRMELEKLEDACKRYEEKEEEMNMTIQEVRERENQAHSKASEALTSLHHVQEENDSLQKRLSEQERVISHYQQKADELLRSREEHRLEKERLRRSQESRDSVETDPLQQEIDRKKQKVRDIEERLERDLESLRNEKLSWEEERTDLQNRMAEIESTMEGYVKEIETLQSDNAKLHEEKCEALNRLRVNPSDKLPVTSAGITDLSDENRPQNLAEKFNEIYDNQWTNALEKLINDCHMTEKESVQSLLGMLKIIYLECKEISELQLQEISTVIGLEPNDEIKMKKLKDFRKSVAVNFLSKIQESVMGRALGQSFQAEKIHCQPYIKHCVEICWLMCVQDPQMSLEFEAENGSPVNEDIFRFYTQIGEHIDFLVWPVLYLYNKGPVVRKGVVQAFSL